MNSLYRQGKRSRRMAMVFTLLSAVVIAGVAVPAQAQTPTVLHTFMQTTTTPALPEATSCKAATAICTGVVRPAEASGSGAIYKISPAGAESVFFSFPQQWTNCGGAGLTLGSDGNFYGACEGGNPATGLGSIFRLTPSRSVYRSA